MPDKPSTKKAVPLSAEEWYERRREQTVAFEPMEKVIRSTFQLIMDFAEEYAAYVKGVSDAG